MTVSYTYILLLHNIKETRKLFVYYYSGLADVPIIWDRAPDAEKGDMGNKATAPAKEATGAENGQTSQEDNPEEFSIATPKKKRSGCSFVKIAYVILSIVTMFKCVAVIAVAVSTAIATKTFSIQQSGRLVAMIILAVTAAITLSIVIYAVLAVFRKQTKPLYAAVAGFIILAIIQTIICSVSVNLTAEDEADLARALLESFRMAKEENTRHVKLWSMTQSDLNCCGVYGSEDYRTPNLPLYFPPDVPISCCPGYDPDRSELVQERERESCKARREYYAVGCRAPVVDLFRSTASLVLSVTIVLLVLEMLLAIFGAIMSRKPDMRRHITVDVVQDTEDSKAKI